MYTQVNERPSYITALSLVRDAVARLPNGRGNRGDILDLLRGINSIAMRGFLRPTCSLNIPRWFAFNAMYHKDSQYIVPTVQEEQLGAMLSSCLDRLQSEPDPCVRYDNEGKTWMYIHLMRSPQALGMS